MRATFGWILLGLIALSGVVWRLQPRPTPGVTELVRVSDLNPLRQEQTDLFNRLHPGLHLSVDPDSGVEKVIVQSLGGVGPDAFDSFDPFELSAYVQAGIALDITDDLAKRGVDLRKFAYPAVLPGAMYQGRVYGVPTNVAVDGLWFHRDIWREAGLPAHDGAWTWAQFIPIAQRLTLRDRNGHAQRFGFEFEWWQWREFFAGFGARVYTPDGTRCILDGPKPIAAIQLMQDLVYKYRVSSSPVEDASMATTGGFGSGGLSVFGAKQAATALGGRWWLAQLRGYKGLDLGVMEAPYATEHRFYGYGRATVINKASRHREAALQYLLFQLGPEYNALVNREADGISAYPLYNRGRAFLHDPAHPEERDNAVWRSLAAQAEGPDSSPFISGQVAAQIIKDQLDLVQANEKSPRAAMVTAAAQINAEIARNVREDPQLAAQFRQAGGSR